MKYYWSIISAWLLILHCGKVPSVPALVLDERYSAISKIESIARCNGPNGIYMTEIHSTQNGACYFSQSEPDSIPYMLAQIDVKGNGFLIDPQGKILDTLSKEMLAVIRGHEIHGQMIDPFKYFSDITYSSGSNEEDNQSEKVFTAKDPLNRPVQIFFNPDQHLINKITLVNPIDTTQAIELIATSWESSQFGKMVKEAQFVQDGVDTFFFHFEYIHIE